MKHIIIIIIKLDQNCDSVIKKTTFQNLNTIKPCDSFQAQVREND